MSKKKSLKHSPGPWVKAIVAASGHDLAGRRDFAGSLYGSEHHFGAWFPRYYPRHHA